MRTIIPEWLEEECESDEVLKKLVDMGADRGLPLGNILDSCLRFVLDRERGLTIRLFEVTKGVKPEVPKPEKKRVYIPAKFRN